MRYIFFSPLKKKERKREKEREIYLFREKISFNHRLLIYRTNYVQKIEKKERKEGEQASVKKENEKNDEGR